VGIDQWPTGERPRERLLAEGAEKLSSAELLAILLRTGVRGASALELSRDLLLRFSGVNGLLHASRSDLASVPGIGDAKVAQLRAAFELSRRALDERLRSRDVIRAPADLDAYLRMTLAGRPYEVFLAVFLDGRNQVIATDELFRGTLTHAEVHPREVVRAALRHNAASIIACHNHPSGIAEPSNADRVLTEALRQALLLVDVRLIDHVIVAGNRTLSFAERGWI